MLPMVCRVADRVIEKTEQALMMYHRLVLVVGASGVGKTNVLKEVSSRVAAPLVNVNFGTIPAYAGPYGAPTVVRAAVFSPRL